MTKPLALTSGEPAGIGPDITLKAWLRREELKLPPFYLLGDRDLLDRRARALGVKVKTADVRAEDAAGVFPDALPIVSIGCRATAQPGRPDHTSADAAIASIRQAVAETAAGRAPAHVIKPTSKNARYKPRFRGPRHTPFLTRHPASVGDTRPTPMALRAPPASH